MKLASLRRKENLSRSSTSAASISAPFLSKKCFKQTDHTIKYNNIKLNKNTNEKNKILHDLETHEIHENDKSNY